MSPVVRVEPSGIEFEARPGETIMAAAERAGYRWPTICGGYGVCRACFVQVVEGGEKITAVEDIEERGLRELAAVAARVKPLRLACQARVEGDVVIVKRGVTPSVSSGSAR